MERRFRCLDQTTSGTWTQQWAGLWRSSGGLGTMTTPSSCSYLTTDPGRKLTIMQRAQVFLSGNEGAWQTRFWHLILHYLNVCLIHQWYNDTYNQALMYLTEDSKEVFMREGPEFLHFFTLGDPHCWQGDTVRCSMLWTSCPPCSSWSVISPLRGWTGWATGAPWGRLTGATPGPTPGG